MEYVHGKLIPVTNVRVTLVSGEGNTEAYADVTLGGCWVVNRLRVVKGGNGVFVAMPQRKDADNNYKDVTHPITAEMRSLVQSAVLEEYQKVKERKQAG